MVNSDHLSSTNTPLSVLRAGLRSFELSSKVLRLKRLIMTNAKEPTRRVKGESPWYLIVTCRNQDDIAAKVTLFAKHVAEHGGADVNVSPNYAVELTRIHASFRELPNNPIQFREQLEQAGSVFYPRRARKGWRRTTPTL
jgi:hypothetical protein